MKKKTFLLLLVTIFLFKCTTQKVVVDQQEKKIESVNRPIIWKQSYFKNISLKDSVLFYNSTEIKLEGELFSQSFFVQDGAVYAIDSINSVSKIVPSITAGGLIEMKKLASGEVKIMLISFSKNEATYRFSFFKKEDGSFTLNGKADLFFRGKRYPITAVTNSECLLLFYFNRKEIREETKEQAEGWKNY